MELLTFIFWLAVVGLGAMGAPMARVLLRAGYLVTVVPHRSRTAAEELAAEGAEIAGTVADAAAGSEVIIALVPDLPELIEVAEGSQGLLAGAHDGLTLLNMSTVGPNGTVLPLSSRSHRSRWRR